MRKRFTTREDMYDQMINKGITKFVYNGVDRYPMSMRIARHQKSAHGGVFVESCNGCQSLKKQQEMA
jgi:hypothetical protein